LQCPFINMLALLLRISIKSNTGFFYQIDYCLYDSLPEDTSYFHAQLRRQAITEIGKDYVILDNVKGSGRYVGTYLGLLLRCTFMCINKHVERYSFSLLHSSVMIAA